MERINYLAAAALILAGAVFFATGAAGVGAVFLAVGALFAGLGWQARR
jgi:hypothetical protein